MSDVVLSVRGLQLSREGRDILRGIDLDVAPGELCALMGPSGSGKTTILRCVAALQSFDSGEIRLGDLTKLLDAYKQTKNKSLRGGGGTGLGLYIVRQIVEAHGGEVTVASIEGVGTSMVLRLPVKRAA